MAQFYSWSRDDTGSHVPGCSRARRPDGDQPGHESADALRRSIRGTWRTCSVASSRSILALLVEESAHGTRELRMRLGGTSSRSSPVARANSGRSVDFSLRGGAEAVVCSRVDRSSRSHLLRERPHSALITAAVTGELDRWRRRSREARRDGRSRRDRGVAARARRLREGRPARVRPRARARPRRRVRVRPRDAGRRRGSSSSPGTAARRRREASFLQAARGGARRARHGRCAAPRGQRSRRHDPARVLQARARADARARRALRGEPADGRRASCRYEAGATKTLDLCLFVNGIPVATAELKNPLTGQTVEHAIAQYRTTATRRT